MSVDGWWRLEGAGFVAADYGHVAGREVEPDEHRDLPGQGARPCRGTRCLAKSDVDFRLVGSMREKRK
jgi:hypothetical protein